MKNIQIIDGAANATFSIFQATEEEFDAIFPSGRDMELAEDFLARVGETRAIAVPTPIWGRPVLKRVANGLHGTLYYDWPHGETACPNQDAKSIGTIFL